MINVYLDSRPVVRLKSDPYGGFRLVPLPVDETKPKIGPDDEAGKWFPDWQTAGKFIGAHYR